MVGDVFLGHVIGFKDTGMLDMMIKGITSSAKAVGRLGGYLHRVKKPGEQTDPSPI